MCNLSKENEICANVPIKLYIVTFYYYEIFNEVTKQNKKKSSKWMQSEGKSIGKVVDERRKVENENRN